MTITVQNRPPTAQNDSYTTYKNTPLTVPAPGVLGNDSDPDGDSLTAVLVSGPSQGTLTLNANGSFTYTPPAGWVGTTTFTYKARDTSNAESNTATVTIEVLNRAPEAKDDEYFMDEDTLLWARGGQPGSLACWLPAPDGVLCNDFDPDGDAMEAQLVTNPQHAALFEFDPNTGSFRYQPEANWFGEDTFLYRAVDPHGAWSEATVTITVMPVNDPPVAQNDSYTTNEDTVLTISAPGVLVNDSDPDGDQLEVNDYTQPGQGSVTMNANGSFTYAPPANWHGETSFIYRVRDPDGALSNWATVTLTVNPVNDPPVAQNDSYTTQEDTLLSISAPGILTNDSDPDGDILQAVLVSLSTQGTLNRTVGQVFDGSFIYAPPADWHGTTIFTYKARDPSGAESNVATVTITVTAVDDPVDAVDDSYETNEDTPLTVSAPGVLGNDSYPDGFGSLAVETGPTNGSVTLNQDGSFTYTPNPNWHGTDSFIYRLTDADGDSDTARVTITVTSVDDPVVANDESYTIDEDTPLTVSAPGVLGNDSYPDGFGSLAVETGP
ncbi:MAG: Ig-like domain-containing protein, partial [Anaerolineae bacterium]